MSAPHQMEIMGTLADQWIEQGKNEGWTEGIVLGKLENSREMLLEAISEKFGTISADLVRRINSVESHETLKMLFKQTFRADLLEEFKEQVRCIVG